MPQPDLNIIIMATMVEAKPFVLEMPFQPVDNAPLRMFKNSRYLLAISGIGKTNAAMTTAYCCTRYSPDCIYNFGAAGALTRSHALGKVYHINKIIEHDRLAFNSTHHAEHTPAVLEGDFPLAVLSTSDKAAITVEERKSVSLSGGELVDMEGAAVTQTCRKFGVPCYLFKYVSDTPEIADDTSIIDNIRALRHPAFEYFRDKVLQAPLTP